MRAVYGRALCYRLHLIILNNAAEIILTRVIYGHKFSLLLSKYLEVDLQSFFPKKLYHFTLSQRMCKKHYCCTTSLTFAVTGLLSFLKVCNSISFWLRFTFASWLMMLITFHILIALSYISLLKCLFKSFVYFLKWGCLFITEL